VQFRQPCNIDCAFGGRWNAGLKFVERVVSVNPVEPTGLRGRRALELDMVFVVAANAQQPGLTNGLNTRQNISGHCGEPLRIDDGQN